MKTRIETNTYTHSYKQTKSMCRVENVVENGKK